MIGNPLGYQILVDSDAFVGWFLEHDAHHERVVKTFAKIKQDRLTTITTSYVVVETTTVLSHRSGQDLARRFIHFVAKLPVIHITEELQKEALELFTLQSKKGTSVVDCSNVVVMERYHIPTILSFDKFYNTFASAEQQIVVYGEKSR